MLMIIFYKLYNMVTRTLVNLFYFLIIPEESMNKEDEELMLDNFVTFFIAGESVLCLL